jgi:hypothetical protein
MRFVGQLRGSRYSSRESVPSSTVPSVRRLLRCQDHPLTPGTSWQWQLGGGPVDETVLDTVDNPKKMYDIDLFGTDAATIDRLQAKGITVICYMETGASENYRPDADQYPAAVLGNAVDGFPDERFVDIRQTDVLLPIITARLDLGVTKGCDGIEPDLDDTYNGYDTGFPLTMQDQLAFNRAVADAAHARGLSVGLKNGASEDGGFEGAMAEFTDWALNEECNIFDECAATRCSSTRTRPCSRWSTSVRTEHSPTTSAHKTTPPTSTAC